MTHPTSKSKFLFSHLLIALLFVALVIEWYWSLSWRQVHDSPILNYIAFLIQEKGKLPYTQIFETSMPITIGFHVWLTKIFGYSDLGFRFADLIFFVCIALITFLILQPWDRRTAVLGVVFFGLYYLWEGHSMSLERDYIAILPISICLLTCLKGKQFFLSGVCWGVACWIKPQTALAAILCTIYLLITNKKLVRSYFMLNLAGFFSVSLLVIGIMWNMGVLGDWWEITTQFLPKHIRMAHNLEVLKGEERWPYLWRGLRTFGQQGKWVLPLVLSLLAHILLLKKNDPTRKQILLLVGLVIFFWLYTAISGQFWKYHWMPFKYCLILGVATLFSERLWKAAFGRILSSVWLVDIVFCLFLVSFSFKYLQPISNWQTYLQGKPIVSEKNKLADSLTAIILQNSKEEDKIQVIDWTEGSIQALLQSKRTLATSFLYDYMFYLDVGSAYTQQLRRRFIQEFDASRPVLVIEMKNRVRVSGIGTNAIFQALEERIRNRYQKIVETNDYCVYKIRKK